MSRDINVVRIKAVANILRKLNREIVFVGGATVALYADEESAGSPIQPTMWMYSLNCLPGILCKKLEQELRNAGFVHDQDSGSHLQVQDTGNNSGCHAN